MWGQLCSPRILTALLETSHEENRREKKEEKYILKMQNVYFFPESVNKHWKMGESGG